MTMEPSSQFEPLPSLVTKTLLQMDNKKDLVFLLMFLFFFF